MSDQSDQSDQSVDRGFVQCANRHYFNPRTNGACPFCGAAKAPAEAVADPPSAAADPPLTDAPVLPLRRDPLPLPTVPPPVTPPIDFPKPVKCPQGHWYDPQTNRECPYCKENAAVVKKRSGCLIPTLLLGAVSLAALVLWGFEPQLAKLISEYRTDSARAAMPAITAFEAAPAEIQSGDAATLRWSVSNATKVSIDPGIGEVPGDHKEVHPLTTTLYTLNATGRAGDVATRQALVAVTAKAEPPPSVDSFTADPSTFDQGQDVVLRWTVRNATAITIDHGVGDVSGDHVTVQPDATTTYKLTASNGTSSATDSTLATLNAPVSTPPAPAASIDAFTAAPATIEKGQATTLRWTVRNATGLAIDHGIGVVSGDSVVVHPDATTTYTLYAYGAKADSRAVTVTVADPAPHPPTPTSATTAESGNLTCRGVSVPPHGEVYFNLPAGKLHFYNLDPPNAWKLHIKTLPDGTQQLFMASQLSTVQTYCAVSWELLYVLQFAAVSSQSDADLIAATLKRRGYKVTQLAGPDKMFHIYLGDPATKKDGEALKQRLLADGFVASFVPAP